MFLHHKYKELQICHRSNDYTRDILIFGIQNEFVKCHTQPLLFSGKIRCDSPLATDPANVDMTLEEDDVFSKDYELVVSRKVH